MAEAKPQANPLHIGQAIALVLVANLLFATVDTSTKWLIGSGLAVLQLAFLRYASQCVITLGEGAARWNQIARPAPRDLALVLLRAFSLVSATVANFVALGQLPLAVTSSIMFLSPVLVCLFSRVLLGEALTTGRILAVLVGFLGALIIFDPFSGTGNWYVLLMLYPASAMALYIVLTRLLVDKVSPHLMQFSTGVMGTVVLAPFGIAAWQTPPSLTAWILAFSIGVFAWAGHEVLTRAHKMAEASALAPYGYSLVLYLMLSGWIVFGDVPTSSTLIGATLIVAAGIVVRRKVIPA